MSNDNDYPGAAADEAWARLILNPNAPFSSEATPESIARMRKQAREILAYINGAQPKRRA